MTARATAAVLLAALGGAAAFVTVGTADPPIGTSPATVYRTIVETRTVQARVQGRSVRWWAKRAIANRRQANERRITLHRIRTRLTRRWTPTVRYGLELARVLYGVDQTRRAWCESRMNPYAANSSGASGLLQFLPSTWATTPFAGFSIWDPVAQSLAGGWMVARGRSSEWTCRL